MAIKDILDFELFNLKDMWGKLKDDPERAFIGAIGPWSSKIAGKVTGKDYEPVVDQMGGAYGGHTLSAFGNKDGGVYKRAEEAGIDTKQAGYLQDAAHVLAAYYAAGGAAGSLGSGGTAGATAAPAAGTAPAAAPAAGGIGSAISGAMPEVVVTGTAGGGLTGGQVAAAAGAAGGAGAAAGAEGGSSGSNQGFNWQKMLGNLGNNLQQQGQSQQQQEDAALEALARRGPPPAVGGSNVGPAPVDMYDALLTPPARRA